MPGENLDISSDPSPKANSTSGNRRFLGIHFTCCDVYTRIYVNHDGTAYTGNCPGCARAVNIGIGEGGSDSRFFYAS